MGLPGFEPRSEGISIVAEMALISTLVVQTEAFCSLQIKL